MNDRAHEAQKILERLHGSSNAHSDAGADADDGSNEYALAEFYQIQKQVIIDRTLGSSWWDMFKKPSYRKRAFLAMATTAIIQCSGVLVINSKSRIPCLACFSP